MKAHVVHDANGRIKSIVFPGTDVEGELEIESDDKDDHVTIVDLDAPLSEKAGAGAATDSEALSSLAHEIGKGFKVDRAKKTLVKLDKK